MGIKNRMLEYLRLLRIQTAATTALTPLIGGLIMGQRDISLLLILLLIGFLYHIYGFVLNEYVDIDIDIKSVDLQNKPLVSGSIPKKYALMIVFLSCVGACLLTIFFLPSVLTILFLLFALLLGGIYDVFGKKIPGSDTILGGSFFSMCLMGASTVSNDFTLVTYVVCSIYFVHIVFNNAVEGGLKDVTHDRIAGAKTLATCMGVSVQQGKLGISKSFIVFAYCVKMIFIGLVVLLGFQQEINLWSERYILQVIMIVFLMIIVFFTLYKFLHLSIFDRPKLKRLFSIHEIASYFILLSVVSPMLEQWVIIFLVFLPSLWYLMFNSILYGKLLQPQV